MSSKTIGDFEKERNFIIRGADPKQKITEEEIAAIPLKDKIGVHHDVRIAFLKANGYEVTRENMVNSELSHIDPNADNEES